jgi:hypothetical protein
LERKLLYSRFVSIFCIILGSDLMGGYKDGADALFILLGAIMILAMHAGFAFLELGTVRKKNQVNALVKILVDFAVSTIAYFFVGYSIAYGVNFFSSADVLAAKNGYELVKFFFLLTFAAAIPAIISGGIAERARFHPQLIATALLVGLVYPFFEGIVWNQRFGIQDWLAAGVWRRLPRLCRFGGGARGGRLGGAAGGAAARRTARPLHEERRHRRASAIVDPVPGAGRLDPDGGLVRLQCHERAGAGQDERPGGRQFADGHGGRHAHRAADG